MFWILTHLGDETALRVAACLRRQVGRELVRLVSDQELVYARAWRHQLQGGRVTSQVILADGTQCSPGVEDVVFNRLRAAHLPQFAGSSVENQNYAAVETQALWLSWLAGLPCPVVNRPSPRRLGAQERGLLEWLMLAAQAGLLVRGIDYSSDPRRFPLRFGSPHRRLAGPDGGGLPAYQPLRQPLVGRRPVVDLEPLIGMEPILVAGETIPGSLPRAFVKPLRELARLAGCDLLQVVFGRQPNPAPPETAWRVCEITSFPDSRRIEEIEAIARLLQEKLAKRPIVNQPDDQGAVTEAAR